MNRFEKVEMNKDVVMKVLSLNTVYDKNRMLANLSSAFLGLGLAFNVCYIVVFNGDVHSLRYQTLGICDRFKRFEKVNNKSDHKMFTVIEIML